jgi:hypothetical protein
LAVKRYVTHLYAVYHPDGRVQPRFDDPGEQFVAEPLEIVGPRPLTEADLPPAPVTPNDFRRWWNEVLNHADGPFTIEHTATGDRDWTPGERYVVEENPRSRVLAAEPSAN